MDVHEHYVSTAYKEALLRHGMEGQESDGLPAPAWSVENQLTMMEHLQVKTAMLLLAAPHCHFGDDTEARELTRAVNEVGRDLVRQYPGRFGLLATLPLPDVEGTLQEISYAFDELEADGIKLPTSAQGV